MAKASQPIMPPRRLHILIPPVSRPVMRAGRKQEERLATCPVNWSSRQSSLPPGLRPPVPIAVSMYIVDPAAGVWSDPST